MKKTNINGKCLGVMDYEPKLGFRTSTNGSQESFGVRTFKDLIMVNRGHKGKALIQWEWHLYKRETPEISLALHTPQKSSQKRRPHQHMVKLSP